MILNGPWMPIPTWLKMSDAEEDSGADFHGNRQRSAAEG